MNLYVQGKNADFRYAEGKKGLLGRTFHHFFELYLFLDGEIEYISARHKQKLSPLQLVVIPPGKYHQFVLSGDESKYKRYVITFEPEFLKDIFSENEESVDYILSLTPSHRIACQYEYLKEIACLWSEKDFSGALTSAITDIALQIKNYNLNLQKNDGKFSELAACTMEYINTNFSKQFDLVYLADKMHCSVSSLCHEFKNNYGISIKKYMLQKRLYHARRDIMNGEKAEAVSLKYGFSSYSSFFRSFVKAFSHTPSKTGK